MRTSKNIFIVLIISTLLFFWCISLSTEPLRNIENLKHLRNNRNLSDYIKEMNLLLEPKVLPCTDKEIETLVIVTSAPFNFEQRDAVRSTYATKLPTLFIVGLKEPNEIAHLIDKHNDDIIAYEYQDHYQNLTLKTALILKWTSERCPSIHFLLKTDDDVLVNPWQLKDIVDHNPDADLIGYVNRNAKLYRNENNKWYMPRWLYAEDVVPEYLSGIAYLINGKHIRPILEAAYEIPLINMEDIYFTYLVAKIKLKLKLTDEYRLYGYIPWPPFASTIWKFACIHSLTPPEMISRWDQILSMSNSLKTK